jgi:Flp pilus assembly protein TadD
MRNSISHLLLAAVTGLLLSGCASKDSPSSGGGVISATDPRRDTELAQQLCVRAVRLIDEGKYSEAEAVLKEALAADALCGPAHNNLGTVYYRQSRMYLAAWEFQYAAELMPHQPEPRNNLGLVFEAVGKLDDAISWYDKASKLEADNPQFLGNLVRARVRRGDRNDEVRDLLSKLVMRETRPEWQEWAKQQLAVLGRVKEDPAR